MIRIKEDSMQKRNDFSEGTLSFEICELLKSIPPQESREFYDIDREYLCIDDYDVDSEEYAESQHALDMTEDILGMSDIIMLTCDDEAGFYEGELEYHKVYEPLQYSKFYKGSEEEILSDYDSSRYIFRTPLGDMIFSGGSGYSWIAMSTKTRDNVVKYIRDNAAEINKKYE